MAAAAQPQPEQEEPRGGQVDEEPHLLGQPHRQGGVEQQRYGAIARCQRVGPPALRCPLPSQRSSREANYNPQELVIAIRQREDRQEEEARRQEPDPSGSDGAWFLRWKSSAGRPVANRPRAHQCRRAAHGQGQARGAARLTLGAQVVLRSSCPLPRPAPRAHVSSGQGDRPSKSPCFALLN